MTRKHFRIVTKFHLVTILCVKLYFTDFNRIIKAICALVSGNAEVYLGTSSEMRQESNAI